MPQVSSSRPRGLRGANQQPLRHPTAQGNASFFKNDSSELANFWTFFQEKYEKEAQALQVQPEADDNLEGNVNKIVEIVKESSASDEVLIFVFENPERVLISFLKFQQNIADQAQDPLEDQDEDDTLIIDNQTDL